MNYDSTIVLIAAMTCTAVLVLAAYASACVYVALRLLRRPRQSQTCDVQHALPKQTVVFPARDGAAQISALFLEASEPRGVVILVHGRGGSKDHAVWVHVMALVERLIRRRFSVLIIDLRGHGQSTPSRMTFGLKERSDVLGAVDWLRCQGYAAGQIAAIGASMGGAAVIGAAAEEPAIGAVISDSAFAEFPSVALRAIRKALPVPVAGLVGRASLRIASVLCGASLERFSPARVARHLVQPLLVVHAAGDAIVPAQHAMDLATSSNSQTWITSATGHGTSFLEFPEEYMAKVEHFLEASLPPRIPSCAAQATAC